MKRSTIGVIGGSGFVGGALAQHLSTDFRVAVLDVKPPNFLEDQPNISFKFCDIKDYQSILRCIEGVDFIIHTAIVQIPFINQQKETAYEVNILGTQNVCKAVNKSPCVMGMILSSSWHTMGEQGLEGIIDEEFGFKPDKVENRAKLYVLSKIAQEAIVRFYDEMSEKAFGIIRLGTVLGNKMPKETAASIFIERGLNGKSLTPYKHSMHRPMLYVDIEDVCIAFETFMKKILDGSISKTQNSVSRIINVYYPESITIMELAEIVSQEVSERTEGKIIPKIEIIDRGLPSTFTEDNNRKVIVNISKAKKLLGLSHLSSPRESIKKILQSILDKEESKV